MADLGGCAYVTLGDRLGKPVTVSCDLNLAGVMESVIRTALQAALLRTPDSIGYSEVNSLYWA